MKAFWEKLKEFLEATQYALWQQDVAVPDYWGGAAATVVRCALFALVLFAGVLFVRLCMLMLEKKRSPRRILTFAATLGVVLGIGWWAFSPRPLTADSVEALSLTRVTQGEETVIPLTLNEQKTLTALLESAQCRRSFAPSLPGSAGKCYRITYQTQGGEASVWVSDAGTVGYTSEETGLLYPIVSGGAFYEALSAL